MWQLNQWSTLIVLTTMLGLHGCVSVNLGGQRQQSAPPFQHLPPSGPFALLYEKPNSQAWKSKDSQSTISYLVDCQVHGDPSLESLREGVFSELRDIKIQSAVKSQFNQRESLRTMASGSVDGVDLTIDLVLLKKHHCLFVLTLASEPRFFGAEQVRFQSFIEAFVVP